MFFFFRFHTFYSPINRFLVDRSFLVQYCMDCLYWWKQNIIKIPGAWLEIPEAWFEASVASVALVAWFGALWPGLRPPKSSLRSFRLGLRPLMLGLRSWSWALGLLRSLRPGWRPLRPCWKHHQGPGWRHRGLAGVWSRLTKNHDVSTGLLARRTVNDSCWDIRVFWTIV